MRKIALILIQLCLLAVVKPAPAQFINWETRPQKGYIFQISNKEAQKLLTKPNKIQFENLLHTLIDTFQVDSGWQNRPIQGHFIQAEIIGNKVQCNYIQAIPYQVFLFREYDALALQVVDKQGNIRNDAKVKIRRKRLRFDSESSTYRIENSWVWFEEQFAIVELDGFSSVLSIRKHDAPNWHYGYYGKSLPSFYSYLITDKNKYKPGETVRFKSYALTGNRTAIRQKMEIWLSDYKKNIKIGEILPQRPGSFAGEFQLHDSLKLTLDKSYNLQLRDSKGLRVASSYFKYEDYELFGSQLQIGFLHEKHFNKTGNQLNIEASDVNGLLLKDAKASILIKPVHLLETFQPFVVIPDTLLFLQTNLDPEKPTIIELPEALFKGSNIMYQAIVTVLNRNNERIEKRAAAAYYHSQYDLVSRMSNDSICFEMLHNDHPAEPIQTRIGYDNETTFKDVYLPYKEKLNPALKFIHLENKFINKTITVKDMNPKLELLGGIDKDSFKISIVNPHLLDLSWYIYQGSTLLKKGFGNEFKYQQYIEDRTNTFYVEVLYSFGGVERILRNQYIFREEFLDVVVDLPERVYPGQTIDATIQVFDQRGRPVSGVDLTALAVTAKLNYQLPNLPYYGQESASRPKSAHYSKKEINKKDAFIGLDYEKWNGRAQLDTMMYYQFSYPSNKPFKYEYDIDDSTQFSVFAMNNGESAVIHVIEVDYIPVYFSWTQKPSRYSFYADPRKTHKISLRLHDRALVIDSIQFQAGKKTIISIDLNNLPKEIKEFKLDPKLSKTERSNYIRYISGFRATLSNRAWIEFDNGFIPLQNFGLGYRSNEQMLVGPLVPGSTTYIEQDRLSIKYQHSGGYNYRFEDNIVYKLTATNLLPDTLYYRSFDPMIKVNDLVLTKDQYLKKEAEPTRQKWSPRQIEILNNQSRMKIFLPIDNDEVGIANVLLIDCKKEHITSPCFNKLSNNRLYFPNHPYDCNSLIILFNNGNYYQLDSLIFDRNAQMVINLNHVAINLPNEKSAELLEKYRFLDPNCDFNQNKKAKLEITPPSGIYPHGNVTGTVHDDTGEPIPGVNIVIKGTSTGTISDIDGNFSLTIDENRTLLQFSFIGFKTEEVMAARGSHISLKLAPEILNLSEVAVIGYGSIARSQVMASVSGVSIHSGEPQPVPDDDFDEPSNQMSEQQLYQQLLTINTIRSNFSDVGFWQPSLYTNRKGMSQFSITFPDDITRWNAVVYAMNRQLKTGTARKSILSYKPIMAELHVPNFLTKGDSAYLLAKALNYSYDSIVAGQVNWVLQGNNMHEEIEFPHFYTNKLLVHPQDGDSLDVQFTFTRTDGYFDGEKRTVPLVEQGIERADGTLRLLVNGDTVQLKARADQKLIAQLISNQLDVYAAELPFLFNYRHACNEQLASRLIGLINNKHYMNFQGKTFKHEKEINQIINRLIQNQNKDFLWSWWGVSTNSTHWISAHILRALKFASDAGYDVPLKIYNLTSKAKYQFEMLQEPSLKEIELLHALAVWDAKLDYPKYLERLDSLLIEKEYKHNNNVLPYKQSVLKEKFLLQEIRQIKNLNYQPDTLLKYKKEHILGGIYFSDNKPSSSWYHNELSINLIAYRLLKNDQSNHELKNRMHAYFLGSRSKMPWNTYQSSGVIMTILPDLLAIAGAQGDKTEVLLHGKEKLLLTEFPHTITLEPGEEFLLEKSKGLPLYLMLYNLERVTEAKTAVDGLKISTSFPGNSSTLEAGKPVRLRIDVEIEKETIQEYVMIEVPIPAGCSYSKKWSGINNTETHREYFKEQTVIYCERMRPGKHSFFIDLLPRFTGQYVINPAQISLMYFPVINANTSLRTVQIKE